MPLNKTIKRELAVAFSKKAQPTWLRLLKYVVIGLLIYFLWAITLFWIILAVAVILALATHFWYRYKTRGWTKSYGGWEHDKHAPIEKGNNVNPPQQ